MTAFDELTLRDVARMSGICKNEYGVWISTLLGRTYKSEERLDAIEDKLREIGSSHAELLEDVESLAEHVADLNKAIKTMGQTIGKQQKAIVDINSRQDGFANLPCLRPIRVSDGKSTDEPCHRHPERTCALKNVVNRMDCAICEETWPKDRKTDGKPTHEGWKSCAALREALMGCKPNVEPINISICLGMDECHAKTFACPADALDFCKTVLDGMRSGKS